MTSEIVSHFRSVDPIIYALSILYPPKQLLRSDNPFFSLLESIISQQLSVKAGETIVKRFQTLFPNENITAEMVLQVPHETLRSVGMSWNKAGYIHNIAEAVRSGNINFFQLDSLDNELLISRLIQIKGIGKWTAEMFLMFSLAREDVFSVGDVGLQRAIQKHYHFQKKPTPEQLIAISNKWSPYRTYACRILWNSLDQC